MIVLNFSEKVLKFYLGANLFFTYSCLEKERPKSERGKSACVAGKPPTYSSWKLS